MKKKKKQVLASENPKEFMIHDDRAMLRKRGNFRSHVLRKVVNHGRVATQNIGSHNYYKYFYHMMYSYSWLLSFVNPYMPRMFCALSIGYR